MPDFTLPQGDLLISPDRQAWVESAFAHLLSADFAQNFTQKVNEAASVDEDFWHPELAWVRPYKVEDGVLHIPVHGVLVDGFPYAFGGWITGYEYITAAIERGAADSMVREIVLDVDSPGGTVAGCFDCADAIYAARTAKPVNAVANEYAYSAAYALASSAQKIAVSRTGGVGSIGVIATHVEMSKALDARGVKVNLIFAGERKADGHPSIPLSDEARSGMQKRVDALYEIFVSTVARNRDMEEQAVRDTEAATFMAREAIEIGLADAVGSLDSLSAHADPSEQEEEEMSNDDTSAVEQAVTPEALAEATATATSAGEDAGRTAERERIAAIMGSEEAKGRESLAEHFAFNTAMDADAAVEALKAAPKATQAEAPDEGASSFEAAMNGGEQPEVGANDAEASEPEAHERVLNTVRKIGLAGFKSKES